MGRGSGAARLRGVHPQRKEHHHDSKFSAWVPLESCGRREKCESPALKLRNNASRGCAALRTSVDPGCDCAEDAASDVYEKSTNESRCGAGAENGRTSSVSLVAERLHGEISVPMTRRRRRRASTPPSALPRSSSAGGRLRRRHERLAFHTPHGRSLAARRRKLHMHGTAMDRAWQAHRRTRSLRATPPTEECDRSRGVAGCASWRCLRRLVRENRTILITG